MGWKTKALVQSCVAQLPEPMSNLVYFRLQRHFGNLRPSRINPTSRLLFGMEFCRQIVSHGRSPRGADFVEVGTGWRLNLPIACWLCGARSVWTLDQNPYLQFSLIKEDLDYLRRNQDQLLSGLWGEYGELLDLGRWRRLLRNSPTSLTELSALCGINYQAPADARRTLFEDHTIDFLVSCNAFEHIPSEDLRDILLEANRITKPSGLLIHRVDHTDHFSHFDTDLSPIHFLRYTDAQWRRYAGNRYAYTNRLREDDYVRLFGECGQEIRAKCSQTDLGVEQLLTTGFPLDARFCEKAEETLSRLTTLFVVSPSASAKAVAKVA
jgi:hypothetical protein